MVNKVSMSVSVPKETLQSIKSLAEKNHRTVSSMVTVILAEAIKQDAQKSR